MTGGPMQSGKEEASFRIWVKWATRRPTGSRLAYNKRMSAQAWQQMSRSWKEWEGQTVDGKFRLLRHLGGSDHSIVFLTERTGPEPRKAAIKLIPADRQKAELQLSRWARTAKLSHPHLLRLFEFGRCQLDNTGLLYVLMEYAEEDLSQILPERPLAPAESREMLKPALEALAYLHSKGFVHGHLKPANIMAVQDQLRISSDGVCPVGEISRAAGTPGVYDPPEITTHGLSPAGDVWSLGMTLVEVLTQRLPAWDRTRQKEPVTPATLPEPFLEIARNCLRLDPQQRWTVAAVAAQLGPSPPARQKKAGQQRPSASRRYVVPAIGAALVLLALLGAPKLLNHRPEARPDQGAQVSSENEQRPVPSAGVHAPSQAPNRPTGERVPGAVAHRVLPEASQGARNTIQGKVKVRVRVAVDSSGNVTDAKFDSAGPSKYFARLAMQAARDWKFAPPQVDGHPVASEWTVRFAFGRAGTEDSAVQVAP